ncbi:baseplate assembly protein [Pseudomonas syringae]|uniref:baseplate assembly protein n=1 Tax=Pseudomonas syringae TaxID=317 RepID=UPI000BB64D72|nr:baseplate J/gp47 family protein [Pseudomonas syringae]PBQ12884.1 baseplate assembly protein [Pseudomonas syringae]
MSAVDLSALPAPQVLEPLDVETTYEEALGIFRDWMGNNWNAALESDPVTKLIELGAYNKLGNRARINDGCKALLLAYARKSDLDQLAFNVNLKRLVIQAEDLTTFPLTAEVKEEDDALRERIQLVYEGLTTAGPRNSYILHARNSSGLVADATAESPSPSTVVVTVLALSETGIAPQSLLDEVRDYLSDENIRPLGDRLIVQSAEILPYTINAVVHMVGTGSENETILAQCEARLKAWVNPRRRLGIEVARSAIDAQLHIAGVRRVDLGGWVDILPTKSQAAYCKGFTLTKGD